MTATDKIAGRLVAAGDAELELKVGDNTLSIPYGHVTDVLIQMQSVGPE